MGSKQKQARFDRLHKRYGEKYPIEPQEIARLRSMVLTGNQSREDVIGRFWEDKKNLVSAEEVIHQRIERLNKALDFLQGCSDDAFADITERNPKSLEEDKE